MHLVLTVSAGPRKNPAPTRTQPILLESILNEFCLFRSSSSSCVESSLRVLTCGSVSQDCVLTGKEE